MTNELKRGLAGSPCFSRQHATTIAFVSLMFAGAGCTDVEGLGARISRLDKDFASINVGMRGADRNTVIAALGKPMDSYIANIGGLQVEVAEFRDRKSQYTIVLFGEHAWFKAAMPIPSATKKE